MPFEGSSKQEILSCGLLSNPFAYTCRRFLVYFQQHLYPKDKACQWELRFTASLPGQAVVEVADMIQAVLDKHWHLAESDYEVDLTELEFAILRVAAAFERWRADCMACSFESPLSGADTAVLHVIRMHDRPKSISEIGRLLNRDDLSNLQYGVRKLANAGVVEKSGNSDSKKGVTYVATELGCEITDNFAQFRRELLISLTQSMSTDINLEDVSKVLNLLAGIYDQASCIAAAHRIAR
jgi:predicted MarR family transcription regulator